MRCHNCSAELSADTVTCPYCGAQLGGAGTYETPVPGGTPDPVRQPAPSGAKTRRKAGGRAIGTVLRYVIGFAVLALVAVGMNIVHQHGSFLSEGDTVDLDEKLAAGEELPMNEFVRLEATFILDTFASADNTLNGVSTGKDTYYVIVLKNQDVIAAKAASKDHIAVLDKGTQDSMDYLNKKLASFDDIPLEGKLVRMDNTELKGFFDEAMTAYGFRDADSLVTPRYLVLDMTAVRVANVLLYLVVPAAAVILAVVGTVLIRKKRKAAKAKQLAE